MSEIIKPGLEKLKELLHYEIDDYGFNHTIKDETDNYDNEETYIVTVNNNYREFNKTLLFRYSQNKLEIEMGEDSWEEVEWFQSSVKYFWMALLNW